MSLGILGNKVGMTQIFTEDGNANPVTIIKVGPCIITQIKTASTDGYNAIQIGYKQVPPQKLTKDEPRSRTHFRDHFRKYSPELQQNRPKMDSGRVENQSSRSDD